LRGVCKIHALFHRSAAIRYGKKRNNLAPFSVELR